MKCKFSWVVYIFSPPVSQTCWMAIRPHVFWRVAAVCYLIVTLTWRTQITSAGAAAALNSEPLFIQTPEFWSSMALASRFQQQGKEQRMSILAPSLLALILCILDLLCRRFTVLNPTSKLYPFQWICEDRENSQFCCLTPSGTIQPGKKVEVRTIIS